MTQHIANYLVLARHAEENLVKGLAAIAAQHALEPDVVDACKKFTLWSQQHLAAAETMLARYNGKTTVEPADLLKLLPLKPGAEPFNLLRDLHSLAHLIHEAHICWIVLLQASMAARDAEMETACTECEAHSKTETMWLQTKMKNTAPQVLVVV